MKKALGFSVIVSILFGSLTAFACIGELEKREQVSAKLVSFALERGWAKADDKIDVKILGASPDGIGYSAQIAVNGQPRGSFFRPVLSSPDENGVCSVERVERYGIMVH